MLDYSKDSIYYNQASRSYVKQRFTMEGLSTTSARADNTLPKRTGTGPSFRHRYRPTHPFESPEDMEKFFMACDTLESPEIEPEWDEHLSAFAESR